MTNWNQNHYHKNSKSCKLSSQSCENGCRIQKCWLCQPVLLKSLSCILLVIKINLVDMSLQANCQLIHLILSHIITLHSKRKKKYNHFFWQILTEITPHNPQNM